MSLAPYLRSKLDPLRVSLVETRYSLDFAGALVLDPRLCWAAELAEFAVVDVQCLRRNVRLTAQVMFGGNSEVELWASPGVPVKAGDALRVTALAWLRPEEVATHHATMVMVGERNSPIEIRRIAARQVRVDPSYQQLPPRQQVFRPAASERPGVATAGVWA